MEIPFIGSNDEVDGLPTNIGRLLHVASIPRFDFLHWPSHYYLFSLYYPTTHYHPSLILLRAYLVPFRDLV